METLLGTCYISKILYTKCLATKMMLPDPEIWKSKIPPFWVLRLGRVRNTSFGTDVSNKMLLNTSKFYAYSFYHSCVIKVKTTWGGEVTLAPPPSAAQINVGKFVDVDNVNLLGNLLCKYIKKNFSCKCWLSFCRFLGWIQK